MGLCTLYMLSEGEYYSPIRVIKITKTTIYFQRVILDCGVLTYSQMNNIVTKFTLPYIGYLKKKIELLPANIEKCLLPFEAKISLYGVCPWFCGITIKGIIDNQHQTFKTFDYQAFQDFHNNLPIKSTHINITYPIEINKTPFFSSFFEDFMLSVEDEDETIFF